MFGRKWRSSTAGFREAKRHVSSSAPNWVVLLFSRTQLEPKTSHISSQHGTRPPREGLRRGNILSSTDFSLALPGREEAVHPQLLALWCLPCYTGKKNTLKFPTPNPCSTRSVLHLSLYPRDRKQPRRRRVGKPASASPHPSTDKVGIRGCTGEGTGSLILSNSWAVKLGRLRFS